MDRIISAGLLGPDGFVAECQAPIRSTSLSSDNSRHLFTTLLDWVYPLKENSYSFL